ncbi:MAG TPA: hypothetical protein VEB59_06655 [Gemmatimonadales bacterium]|nr:hypothetical protein [Gemmatimonadales bacterium]
MRALRTVFRTALAVAALTAVSAAPGHAQGKGKDKHYAVSNDKAMTATRAVLQRQGYEIVRVVRQSDTQVLYYRRGNNGRGKGQGPMERMVIRTVDRRVVFEEVPSAILVDIDFELKL